MSQISDAMPDPDGPAPGDRPQEIGFLLVPGFGAQGGTPSDVRRVCGSNLDAAMINVSRSVLSEGPDVEKLRAATSGVIKELSQLGKVMD